MFPPKKTTPLTLQKPAARCLSPPNGDPGPLAPQVRALYAEDALWSDPLTECKGVDSIVANFDSLAVVAGVRPAPLLLFLLAYRLSVA